LAKNKVPGALRWLNSNSAVVKKVSPTGLLTAKSSGNWIITVTSPDTNAKSVIQCRGSVLATINVAPKKLEMMVGEKHNMEATVLNERNESFEN
jgi:uncharacterized protein YjdB